MIASCDMQEPSTATADAVVRAVRSTRDDPALFARAVLGLGSDGRPDLWWRQREILASVRDNQCTAVAGGHGTSKGHSLAVSVLWYLCTRPGSWVVTTSPTGRNVKDALWADIRRLYNGAPRPLGGRLLDTSLILDDGSDETWRAVGISTDRPSAFQGRHSEDVLIVMDEAQGIAPEIWDAAEGMLTGPRCRWLVAGNPIVTSGRFHDCFTGSRARWHCINVSCWEHVNVIAEQQGRTPPIPNAVTLQYCESRRELWEKNAPALYDSRVLGRFPTTGEDNVIPLSLLEASDRLVLAHTEKDERHLGVDVARFGTDQCVASLVIGGELTEQFAWGFSPTTYTAGRVRALARDWRVPAHCVHIDEDGVGGGVIDQLRLDDFLVDGIQSGSSPVGDWQRLLGSDTPFRNRKAELWWAARSLMDRGLLKVPRRFAETWSQLSAHRYSFTPKGAIQIEEKKAVKERIQRSPDHADSLILALARSGRGGPLFRIIDRRDLR